MTDHHRSTEERARFGIADVEVINLAKAGNGMVRVTLSDHADGTISVKTASTNAPNIGDAYRVTFTPLAAA